MDRAILGASPSETNWRFVSKIINYLLGRFNIFVQEA
jgi:hypothetical protein